MKFKSNPANGLFNGLVYLVSDTTYQVYQPNEAKTLRLCVFARNTI